ncbi:MAG: hypothetical protein ABFS86_04535 [Planctomycetota bacterium]
MSRDTTFEIREKQIELLREAPPSRRLQLALSLSRSVMELSRRGIARAHPEWSELARDIEFVRIHYGEELAEGLERHLRKRG